MKKFVFTLLAVLAVSLGGYAQLETILKDIRFFNGPMEKIAFITQVSDEGMRQYVESSMEASFTKKKIGHLNVYDYVRSDTIAYYSTLERQMYDAGADGVLIIKLVDVELSDMYIIPGGVLPPDAYNYYEFYSVYYYYDLKSMSIPGYLQREDRSFRLDANLYQGKGDMIIWSVQSNLIDPNDYTKAVDSFIKKLAKGLLSEKLVKTKK